MLFTYETLQVDEATNTNVYMYRGGNGEKVPSHATSVIIDKSVKIIKQKAFKFHRHLKKCFMHDGVHTIEKDAFFWCMNLKTIRLSRNLKHIGERAFCNCDSLEALFFPPTIEKIDSKAFGLCPELRILPLHAPINMDIVEVGEWILFECDNFFNIFCQIQRYQEDDFNRCINKEEVHQSIVEFYHNLHPLHKTCLSTDVSESTISASILDNGAASVLITDHNGMTPLHILTMNPHADSGAITACFTADMSAIFLTDNRGKTPLDYLGQRLDIDDHTLMVASLCNYRDMMAQKAESSSIHASPILCPEYVL